MERITVLLVDDEVDFTATLSRRLGKRGCEVLVAHDGETAMDMLAGNKVDVVLLDVKMPNMDGVQTLKRIKKMHDAPEVVMLSGHLIPDAVISSMAMGAFDYLTKPFPMDKLLPKLRGAARVRNSVTRGREED